METLRQTAFKRRESFQYMLCHRDCAERIVAIFAHQMKSEYYSGNRSVYIEGIVLENFSALPQTKINSSTKACPRHAVFHYFLSYDRKQYASTTNAHSKRFIKLFKNKNY